MNHVTYCRWLNKEWLILYGYGKESFGGVKAWLSPYASKQHVLYRRQPMKVCCSLYWALITGLVTTTPREILSHI